MKKMKIGDMLNNIIWFKKEAIRKGSLAKFEDFRKGTTIFLLVLLANQDLNTKIIKTTYKELSSQTGFSYTLIRKLLNNFEEHGIIERFSKQGSRKTVLKLHEFIDEK